MNVSLKHQIALANIHQIYQAGWLPTVPYNSGIAPVFTCVVDADHFTRVTLHINNVGKWFFVFTIANDTYEFFYKSVPTVKQVRYIVKTYYQAALKQGELSADLEGKDK